MARKNGYILAFLAAIIGFISLIAPVAYHTNVVDSYIWMWGLYSWKILAGDTDYNLSEESGYLTWGLTATLLILIASILLILSAAKANKRKKSYGFLWVFCGLLLIAAPIIYYIGLLEEYPTWLTEVFWDFYDFHFAFYGPFIGGAFAIIGGIIR